MHVQASTLQPELIPAVASTDASAPLSTINSPSAGTAVANGTAVTISGTATDAGGGHVAGVEVSTDGGQTWHPAVGTATWSYMWVANGYGEARLQSRAVDDSGNLETPLPAINVNVTCPCSIWDGATQPAVAASGDAARVEPGVKFTASVAGYVTGVRFFKGAGNTGTHLGSLWSGKARCSLARPSPAKARAAGSRSTSPTRSRSAPAAPTSPPTTPPTATTRSTSTTSPAPTATAPCTRSATAKQQRRLPLRSRAKLPRPKLAGQQLLGRPRLHHQRTPRHHPTHRHRRHPRRRSHRRPPPAPPSPPPSTKPSTPPPSPPPPSNSATAQARSSQPPSAGTHSPGARPSPPPQPLANNTTYTATIKGGSNGIADPAGNHLASDHNWSFTTGAGSGCPCSLWPATQPTRRRRHPATATPSSSASSSPATSPATSRGVRFYKGAGNTGTPRRQPLEQHRHAARARHLHRRKRERLAAGQLRHPGRGQPPAAPTSPPTTPPTATTRSTSTTSPAPTATGPCSALADSQGSNGVYRYAAAPSFPDQTWQASNYWVDIVFTTNAPLDTTPPTVTDVTPAAAATGVRRQHHRHRHLRRSPRPRHRHQLHLPTPRRHKHARRSHRHLGRTLPARHPHPHRRHSPTTPPTPPRVKGGANGIADPAGNHLARPHLELHHRRRIGLPLHASGRPTPTRRAGSGDSSAVELGRQVHAPTAPATSPASASTRAPATPAPTSAASGPRNGTLLARATFTGESAQRLAAGQLRHPGRGHRRHAPTSPPTTPPTATTRSTSTTSPAPSQQRARCTRSPTADGGNGVYRYGSRAELPRPKLAGQQLLGRRRLHHQRTPRHHPAHRHRVTPAAAATDVPTSTTVTATFNEALDPATITTTTFQLRDNAGNARRGHRHLRRARPQPSHPRCSRSTSTPPTPPRSRAAPTGSPTPPATTSQATTLELHGQACPCSLWSNSVTPPITATGDAKPSSSASSSRRTAPARHRNPLLQGRRQHRHPRRQPLDQYRHAARPPSLHRRDRHRLATGHLRGTRRDHRRHDLRRLLLRPQRPLRRRARLLRAFSGSREHHCWLSAIRRREETASTGTARLQRSRSTRTARATTRSTFCSSRPEPPARM